jgi:hypothetical protein
MRYLPVVLLTLFLSLSPLKQADAADNTNVAIGGAAIGAVVGAVALPLVAPVAVAAVAATYLAVAGVATYAPITVSAAVGAVTGYFLSE